MNPLVVVVLGWLGINVAVVVAALLARDPDGDKLDVHEILDGIHERGQR